MVAADEGPHDPVGSDRDVDRGRRMLFRTGRVARVVALADPEPEPAGPGQSVAAAHCEAGPMRSLWKSGTPSKIEDQFLRTGSRPVNARSGCAGCSLS